MLRLAPCRVENNASLLVSWAVAGPATAVRLTIDGVLTATTSRASSNATTLTVDIRHLDLKPGAIHNLTITAVDGWTRYELERASRDTVETLSSRPARLSSDSVFFTL